MHAYRTVTNNYANTKTHNCNTYVTKMSRSNDIKLLTGLQNSVYFSPGYEALQGPANAACPLGSPSAGKMPAATNPVDWPLPVKGLPA